MPCYSPLKGWVDSETGVYDRPFVGNADAMALRGFGDICSDADHPFGKHPEHYSLFRVGTFDDNTGDLVGEPAVCIGKAHELIVAGRIMRQANGGAEENSHAS